MLSKCGDCSYFDMHNCVKFGFETYGDEVACEEGIEKIDTKIELKCKRCGFKFDFDFKDVPCCGYFSHVKCDWCGEWIELHKTFHKVPSPLGNFVLEVVND